jgi:hypothetical protein
VHGEIGVCATDGKRGHDDGDGGHRQAMLNGTGDDDGGCAAGDGYGTMYTKLIATAGKKKHGNTIPAQNIPRPIRCPTRR